MANNTNERTERSNYVPGFEPVLLRSESKRALKDFRFSQINVPRDMHIERHLVTAAINLVLSDEATQGKWLDYVRESMRTDIDNSVGLNAQPAG